MSNAKLAELRELLNMQELPAPKNTTEAGLYLALNRLISGKPSHPKNQDGKLNFAALHREAKATNGTIKYYPTFKDIALKAFEAYRGRSSSTNDSVSGTGKASLKDELNNEKRLKTQYRDEKDALKEALDIVVLRETELLFRLHELENQLREDWNDNVHTLKPSSK